MNKLIPPAFLLLLAISNVSGQGWRGVVPLRSSCDDFKRITGVATCQTTTYDLVDEKVAVAFSDGTCETGWRVPEGRVLWVLVHPRSRQKISDLQLDGRRYKKVPDSHLREVTYYDNEDDGVSIATFSDGTVAYLSYGPAKTDKGLECPQDHTAMPPRASKKFDEYESLESKEEESRLDNFVTQLKAETPEVGGYVIAYGRHGRPQEAHERAVRVKAYLLSKGVPSDRITTVEGEARDNWMIQLFLVYGHKP
jgi:hypothetical protein